MFLEFLIFYGFTRCSRLPITRRRKSISYILTHLSCLRRTTHIIWVSLVLSPIASNYFLCPYWRLADHQCSRLENYHPCHIWFIKVWKVTSALRFINFAVGTTRYSNWPYCIEVLYLRIFGNSFRIDAIWCSDIAGESFAPPIRSDNSSDLVIRALFRSDSAHGNIQ